MPMARRLFFMVPFHLKSLNGILAHVRGSRQNGGYPHLYSNAIISSGSISLSFSITAAPDLAEPHLTSFPAGAGQAETIQRRFSVLLIYYKG